MFTHHCIQTVTIKLYSQNLIYKYITHHHTHEKSDTINMQILKLSDGQLLTLIEIEPFSILMLTTKFLSSATFNKYRKSKNNIHLLQHRRLLQEKLNSFFSVSKQNYYSRMSARLTKYHTGILVLAENIFSYKNGDFIKAIL